MTQLWVHYRPEGGLPKQIKQRKASPADILAAARTLEGAEEKRSFPTPRAGWGDLLTVPKPGRYLVVPLDTEGGEK